MGDFQELEHTADWALRVRGSTLQELFAAAAQGMYSLATDGQPVQPQVERLVEVAGLDAETLLVNWLNELLYYTEVEGIVFGQFEVLELAPERLRAVARGQAGVPLHVYVKAVTFNNLRIESTGQGYVTTLVFDI